MGHHPDMTGARDAALTALIGLARSPHFRDRADAGHGLARFTDEPAACEVLLELVLDAADTGVTYETATALFRRGDAGALAVLSAATAGAEDSQHDHLHDALHTVLLYERDRDAALAICRTLTGDPDEQVRSGAEVLVAELLALRPPFRNADGAV
jgi:hypothetical protein